MAGEWKRRGKKQKFPSTKKHQKSSKIINNYQTCNVDGGEKKKRRKWCKLKCTQDEDKEKKSRGKTWNLFKQLMMKEIKQKKNTRNEKSYFQN